MIGQGVASLHAPPRRWLQRLWGIPDIHTRQKWAVLSSYFSHCPNRIRLLDAGCGNGTWALELAVRHPSWTIVGIDKSPEAIQRAEHSRRALGQKNVIFVEADFLYFHPAELFDLVLSIASAHYLVEVDRGRCLFDQFHRWLRPGGQLLLLGPRRREEVPSLSWLPAPPSNQRDLFSRAQLTELCQQSGLSIKQLVPTVFFLGTVAKQLCAVQGAVPRIVVGCLYPLTWLLSITDPILRLHSDRSCLWVLNAVRA